MNLKHAWSVEDLLVLKIKIPWKGKTQEKASRNLWKGNTHKADNINNWSIQNLCTKSLRNEPPEEETSEELSPAVESSGELSLEEKKIP